MRGHTDEVTAVAVTPDGQHIVSGAEDNTVRVWNLNQTKVQPTTLITTSQPTIVAITANGQNIIFVTKKHKLFTWRPQDKAATFLTEKEAEITAVTLTNNDQAVIIACRDHSVEVWDLATKQRKVTYTGDAIPLHLSVTPNHNVIAVGDENGKAILLQLEGLDK